MDHHRRRRIGEGPRLDQVRLAAVALLSGRAEHGDPDTELVGHPRQTDSGTGGRGGDDVVSARMAHLGQGVVLGADHHFRAGAPRPRGEGGVHSVGGVLDLEAVLVEQRRQSGGGLVFLESQLRVLVHPARQLEQRRFDVSEAALDGGFEIRHECLPGRRVVA